jgi:hypothetical protein
MSVSDACLAEQLAVNDGLTDIELVTSVQSALLANLQHLRGSYSNAISVKAKRKRRKQTKAKRQFIQFFFFFFFFLFKKTMWTLLAAFVAFLILAGLALIQVAISRSQSDNVLFKVECFNC